MIVYGLKDKIQVKVGAFTFVLTPLSVDDKAVISASTVWKGGKATIGIVGIIETIRRSVKEMSGLKDVKYPDGRAFKLAFDENGILDDESVHVVMQICGTNKMVPIATCLMADMLRFDIPGIEVIPSKHSKKKR